MTLSILFLAMALPTVWELWNDRRGDLNKFEDGIWRVTIAAVASIIVKHSALGFLAAFNLSMAIHFMFFDYIIAYILIKNGTLEPPRGVKYHWFSYTAKSGVIDNLKFWRNMNPWLKLGIRVAYFIISITLFIIL